jgi:hypothetical protein
MKLNLLTVSATNSWEQIQVANPFMRVNASKFSNAVPGEIISCINIYEVKMYVLMLMCALSLLYPLLLIPAYGIYCSAKKGGQNHE